MSRLEPAAAADSRELVIARVLDAPRTRVFDTWINQLPRWWGPHGTTMPLCELDPRPGGAFRTTLRAPDGTEYPTRAVFLEVSPPERIVFTDAFEPGWRPHAPAFFTAVVTFDEHAGATMYRVRALHWDVEGRRRHEVMGFHQGWSESIERLEALLGRPAAVGVG